MEQMLLNSTENIEKLKSLEEEKEHYSNKNAILKESLNSLSSKLDRRERDVEKLLAKLEEVEQELEGYRTQKIVSVNSIFFLVIVKVCWFESDIISKINALNTNNLSYSIN